MIALQIWVGLLFLVLGITGLAKKLLDIVPIPLQAGIILGAGISALIGKYVFGNVPGFGFNKYPLSITIGGLIALYLLFSEVFIKKVRAGQKLDKADFWVKVANYGMVPGLVVGIIVAWVVGEVPLPKFTADLIFMPRFAEVWKTQSIFGVGIPSVDIWIAAIPMALIAYIIAFGDVVIGTTCIKNANEEFRHDEIVDRDPNRLSLLCAVRNFLEGDTRDDPDPGRPAVGGHDGGRHGALQAGAQGDGFHLRRCGQLQHHEVPELSDPSFGGYLQGFASDRPLIYLDYPGLCLRLHRHGACQKQRGPRT